MKILGYKTHRKVELTKGCDESDNNYPYTIGMRTEYQHATKDADFSTQERLDGRRRYVFSSTMLISEKTLFE